MNGRSRMTAESRLAWHSQDGILQGMPSVSTVMLLTSLVFLRTYQSQETAGLSALLIDLLIPREVIRDVNTKILLGRDNFKLRAGHMIDKDDGFKCPSDALGFPFAVVKV